LYVVRTTTIDTRNLLYHFLQHELATDDVALFEALVPRLVMRLGIWLPRDVYARLPILTPYARRDPNCRGNAAAGTSDAWGTPDQHGYFRDDNSLVKGIPRSMTIISTARTYQRRRLGTGFVACHVWREIHDDRLASHHPLTYSFVPNLVWLPAQVAALSDREGSFAQRYLQALSHRIYRSVPVRPGHRERVEAAWALIPGPVGIPDAGLPAVDDLNFFAADAAFFARRQRTIRSVAEALASGAPSGKIVSRRYTEGIPALPVDVRKELADDLGSYAASIA
jgi:hypothetical protein